MPTYRLDIEYLGSDWHGWQVQPGHQTIQGALQTALSTAVRSEVFVTGSGRTDAGVHASGQVAHFLAPSPLDTHALRAKVNGLVPDSIAITAITEVSNEFHSRFDARWRRYRYRLGTHPFAIGRDTRWFVRPLPDVAKMNVAAANLIGTHNCTSFCRTASDTENRKCEIYEAAWTPGPFRDGDFDFVISADRFLHGMVRTIVGTLIEIGHGKREECDMIPIIEARDRVRAGFAAPAKGLMLEKVGYKEDSP